MAVCCVPYFSLLGVLGLCVLYAFEQEKVYKGDGVKLPFISLQFSPIIHYKIYLIIRYCINFVLNGEYSIVCGNYIVITLIMKQG